MQRDIIQQWYFQHPPERVWEFLTNPELLAQWLMENDFQPVVGHKFRFVTKPKIKLGFDGIVYCEVLELVPYQRLSYSWKGGAGKGKIHLDSVVRWTLTPKDNGTLLLLEHTGFRGMKNFLTYMIMSKGWAGPIQKRVRQLMDKQAHEKTTT